MATPPKATAPLFPTPEDRLRFLAWVDSVLQPGVDFILAHRPGCALRGQQGRVCQSCGAKATLSKAGAERVCIHLGLVPQFERDQDTWEMLGKKAGTLCYICTLHRGSAAGPIMGEGRGARLVEQDGGDVNMAIKMGSKSSQCDATLRAAGLSERFTQDVGENEPVARAEGRSPAAHGVLAEPTRVDAPPPVTPGGSGAEARPAHDPPSSPSAPTGPATSEQGTSSLPSGAGPATQQPAGLPPLTHPVEFTLSNGQVVKGQFTAGVTSETVTALSTRTAADAKAQERARVFMLELGLPQLRYLNEEQGKALLAYLNEPEAPAVPRRRTNGSGELDWDTAHAELVRVATVLSTPTPEEQEEERKGVTIRRLSLRHIEELAAAVYKVERVEQLSPHQVCTVAAEIETMGLKDRPALWIALGQAGVS